LKEDAGTKILLKTIKKAPNFKYQKTINIQ